MRPPGSSLRLRLPRIEKKPKRIYDERWNDFAGVRNDPDLFEELYQLIQCIERGEGVPDHYYRAGIDRDRDTLLERRVSCICTSAVRTPTCWCS